MAELDELYQDIHGLTEQIHKLEKAVALLLHEYVYLYKKVEPSGSQRGTLDSKVIDAYADNLQQADIQELIDEFGGDRKFIESFLNPTEK